MVEIELNAHINRTKFRFCWDEKMGVWWLQAPTYDNTKWVSAYFPARDLKAALEAANRYMGSFGS